MVVHTTTYVCSTLGKLAMPPHVSGTLLEYCGSKEQRCLHYACDAVFLSCFPRPSAGPLYLPHPPAPPSLPYLPSNSKELVPPWFKVCCWSLIKGRPIPPFSFQPYVVYVLLLGQLLLARAGTLKHQPKEVRQPAAAWAVTAMQPGSRRQSASSFSNPIQHSEQ